MIKLSILVCTIPSRLAFLGRLKTELAGQILPYAGEIELLIDPHPTNSIGQKRNDLMSRSVGEYQSFIDDDDRISPNYIRLLMEGIQLGVDACSLKGIITENGEDPQYFEHYMTCEKYETVEGADFHKGETKYLRFNNHLNCIKSSIAKQFTFPEKNFSEDTDWAIKVHESGLIKTEHYINEVLYHYDYIRNK